MGHSCVECTIGSDSDSDSSSDSKSELDDVNSKSCNGALAVTYAYTNDLIAFMPHKMACQTLGNRIEYKVLIVQWVVVVLCAIYYRV
jgi:hypothetical protein